MCKAVTHFMYDDSCDASIPTIMSISTQYLNRLGTNPHEPKRSYICQI